MDGRREAVCVCAVCVGVVRSINTRSTVVVVILRTSPADTTLLLLALPLVYPLPPPPCRLCQ